VAQSSGLRASQTRVRAGVIRAAPFVRPAPAPGRGREGARLTSPGPLGDDVAGGQARLDGAASGVEGLGGLLSATELQECARWHMGWWWAGSWLPWRRRWGAAHQSTGGGVAGGVEGGVAGGTMQQRGQASHLGVSVQGSGGDHGEQGTESTHHDLRRHGVRVRRHGVAPAGRRVGRPAAGERAGHRMGCAWRRQGLRSHSPSRPTAAGCTRRW